MSSECEKDDSPSAGEEPQPTSETDASSFQSFWDFLPAAVGSSEVRKGIFLSMLCGVFSSSWSPFTSLAMTREHRNSLHSLVRIHWIQTLNR